MSGYALGQPYAYGRSFQSSLRGDSPAAGQSFSLALDGRWTWRLLSCVWTLTTDANAANRYVTLEYLDIDGVALAVNAPGVIVTANTTIRYAGSLTRGVAEWATNTDVLFPLVPVFLFGGQVLKINVASIQATDTLTAIRFLFDRFPSGGEQPAEYEEQG